MTETTFASNPALPEALQRQGYAFVEADAMRAILTQCGPLSDWPAFAASWNDLAVDTYMADRGRYRRRRHAVYTVAADGPVRRAPHQPHYQGLEYNPLNGGVARWFEPTAPEIGDGASLRTILGCCRMLFGRLAPDVRSWHVQTHQFRIAARA